MKLTKLSAATMAALAILGLGVQGQAHADALGQARMLITGFTITDGSVAGTPLNISAFVPGSLGFTDNLSTSANLNGIPAAGAGIGLGFQPSVNALQSCVGSCGVGENLFGVLAAPSSLSRARSDSFLEHVPISGTSVPTVGANASTLAESVITGTGVGGSSTDIELASAFTFQLARPIAGVGMIFDVDTLLRTWTSTGSVAPTLASASFNWSITLEDALGNVLIEWEPDGNIGTGKQTGLTVTSEACDLNQNSSAGPNSPQAAITCNGQFAAVTNFALAANTTYSFNISQESATLASAVDIPEPGSVALLGIALAGLGATNRKRKAMQA